MQQSLYPRKVGAVTGNGLFSIPGQDKVNHLLVILGGFL
jgi:hypothetical protein